ncbi:methyltransferase domain-containing protein [Rhodobacterales bacterium HKCCSP123]|nr:methyltransferase domain-containing protein [Rhodobacterales bacterium HKCCSP123]
MTRTQTDCPLCGATAPPPAITVDPVPVHSVVLFHDRRAAEAARTGRIALTACGECGFVWNAAFDPALMDYAGDYEATQAHSPSFNAFHRTLATRIAEAAAGRPGHVVEIGCGQGEFLVLLEDSGCPAPIGYDPAFGPERAALREGGSATVMPVEFPRDPELPPVSAVVCKMTLEHIADPLDLLRRMSMLSRKNAACPVFVLVPNATDVFRRGAFWDVYHEHCTYFTEATLGHAMARSGLAVTDAAETYGGQYLIVAAEAADDPPLLPRPATDPDGDLRAFLDFVTETAATRAFWTERLEAAGRRGERLLIWGAGSKAVAFLTFAGRGTAIVGAVDINPHKHGTFLPASGLPVFAPEDWRVLAPDRIILMNGAYLGEVSRQCARMGLEAPIDCLDMPPLNGGKRDRVCIGVATRGRPGMLSALLASLRDLAVPEGVELVPVIVENGSVFTLDAHRTAMRDWGPSVFALEPVFGIPHARNTVLEISLRLQCTHTAFIDDDEMAEPGWIGALLAEARRGDLDLVGGPVALAPDDVPRRGFDGVIRRGLEARLARVRRTARRRSAQGRAGDVTVVTSNWLVRNAFLHKTSLRFDPAYGISGGSDTAFFHCAKALGAKTGWSDAALVLETVPADRLTLGYQFRRAMGQSMTAYHRKHGGPTSIKSLARSVGFSGYKLTLAAILLAGAPLTGGRSLVDSARAAGFAIGRLRALRGEQSSLYARIQGY